LWDLRTIRTMERMPAASSRPSRSGGGMAPHLTAPGAFACSSPTTTCRRGAHTPTYTRGGSTSGVGPLSWQAGFEIPGCRNDWSSGQRGPNASTLCAEQVGLRSATRRWPSIHCPPKASPRRWTTESEPLRASPSISRAMPRPWRRSLSTWSTNTPPIEPREPATIISKGDGPRPCFGNDGADTTEHRTLCRGR
jgi:hypothetical protein